MALCGKCKISRKGDEAEREGDFGASIAGSLGHWRLRALCVFVAQRPQEMKKNK